MQFFTLPTTVFLLSFALSTTASPLPIPTTDVTTNTLLTRSPLVLDTRATPQFVSETPTENELETRTPRFKIITPGTTRPAAPAPKTGVVQSIKNGLKKLICNDNNCVEPATESDAEGSF